MALFFFVFFLTESRVAIWVLSETALGDSVQHHAFALVTMMTLQTDLFSVYFVTLVSAVWFHSSGLNVFPYECFLFWGSY